MTLKHACVGFLHFVFAFAIGGGGGGRAIFTQILLSYFFI